MSLDSWLANGWLVEHEAGRGEIANLLAIVDRDTAGMISAQEAEEVVDEALALRDDVLAWLEQEHPRLL